MQVVIAEFNTSKDQNSLAFWICFKNVNLIYKENRSMDSQRWLERNHYERWKNYIYDFEWSEMFADICITKN